MKAIAALTLCGVCWTAAGQDGASGASAGIRTAGGTSGSAVSTAPVAAPRAQTPAPVAPGSLNNPPVVSTPDPLGQVSAAPNPVGQTFQQPVIGGPTQSGAALDRASAAQRVGIPTATTAGATAGPVAPGGITPGWMPPATVAAPATPQGLQFGIPNGNTTVGIGTTTTIVPGAAVPGTVGVPRSAAVNSAASVNPPVTIDFPPGTRIVTSDSIRAGDRKIQAVGRAEVDRPAPDPFGPDQEEQAVGRSAGVETGTGTLLPPPGSSATPLNPSIRSPNIIQTRPLPE